jgi:hypothetical protein
MTSPTFAATLAGRRLADLVATALELDAALLGTRIADLPRKRLAIEALALVQAEISTRAGHGLDGAEEVGCGD